MILDQATWETYIKGYSISDGVVSNENRFWFRLDEEVDDPDYRDDATQRFLSIDCNLPMDKRCYALQYEHFSYSRMEYRKQGKVEVVTVDHYGSVYSYDAQRDGTEDDLDVSLPDCDYNWVPTRLVRAGGEFYAIGTCRRIVRRIDINRWAAPEDIPYSTLHFETGAGSLDEGFYDMSAFAADDMYVVGGFGDVWHFDGSAWKQLAFPSNDWLQTVCCAGDGKVYISGKGGSIWVGRLNHWAQLLPGELDLPFRDTLWFGDRLWCGNDYGLWSLQDGKLVPLSDSESDEVVVSTGRLNLSHDGRFLLSMSPVGAALYDGKHWRVLFNRFAFLCED